MARWLCKGVSFLPRYLSLLSLVYVENDQHLCLNTFVMSQNIYQITIDAPREKVWHTLWDDATYPLWTAPFAEGSTATTDWKEGSRVYFGDGKGEGMVAMILENREYEFMSIKHLGLLKDGKEDLESEESQAWGDSYENYTLKEVDGGTHLLVELTSESMPAEFEAYFAETWPKALDKLKELAEG